MGITNLMFSRSLFTNLICSFIVIILVLSSFNIFSYKFYINNIEKQIINNTNERFNNVFKSFDQYFDLLQKTAIRLYLEKDIQSILNKKTISNYDVYTVYKILNNYSNDFPYVSTFYLFTQKTDFIITPHATYNKDSFFNTFYYNTMYTEDFWLWEGKKNFNYRLYPAMDFIYYASPGKARSYYLMPIVFKGANNGGIIVALIDIVSLANDIDSSFMKDFYIVDYDNTLLYTNASSADFSGLSEDLNSSFKKVDQGYLFSLKSNKKGIKYYKLIPNDEIKRELRKTNLIFVLFIIISIIISLIISIYMVIKFNNPVKQIAALIDQGENDNIKNAGVNLYDIQNHVQKMVSENIYYAEKINERDSMLKNFLYQSKIKNIYSDINQIIDEAVVRSDYAIIYFKVHYRDRYFQEVSSQSCVGTFYLKELIELYIENSFDGSITFHTEKDQIISIVNVDTKSQNIRQKSEDILDKLKSEDEYLFLTVVISNVYKDISKLSDAYYRTIELSKYRQLKSETQLLCEDEITMVSNKFYFPLEQVERFTKLLYNARKDEAICMVKNLLEYNFKKEINQFYMNLLSIEIINHAIKVLIELYYDIPDEFDIESIYSQLDNCLTLEQYTDVCVDFVSSIVTYIETHAKEEDYIVDYVKQYIEDNYMNDIYLDLLADNLGISKSYLSSYFKDKTGENLNDYLNNFRIQKALKLLTDSTIKVQDVAEAVGISNANTFTRLFKKFTGQTPTEYRQSKLVQK